MGATRTWQYQVNRHSMWGGRRKQQQRRKHHRSSSGHARGLEGWTHSSLHVAQPSDQCWQARKSFLVPISRCNWCIGSRWRLWYPCKLQSVTVVVVIVEWGHACKQQNLSNSWFGTLSCDKLTPGLTNVGNTLAPLKHDWWPSGKTRYCGIIVVYSILDNLTYLCWYLWMVFQHSKEYPRGSMAMVPTISFTVLDLAKELWTQSWAIVNNYNMILLELRFWIHTQ